MMRPMRPADMLSWTNFYKSMFGLLIVCRRHSSPAYFCSKKSYLNK